MSYGMHVEREGAPIEDSEWRALLGTDPSLRLLGVLHGTNPGTGEVIDVEAPGLVEWLGHPQGKRVLLDHAGGRISVADPDEHSMALLLGIAARLGAVVVGDEGERYA